jgi:hypothetical protein
MLLLTEKCSSRTTLAPCSRGESVFICQQREMDSVEYVAIVVYLTSQLPLAVEAGHR